RPVTPGVAGSSPVHSANFHKGEREFALVCIRASLRRKGNRDMFDLLHKHKRFTQLVLALITLPFAFFGVDYYFRSGSSDQTVATVGKNKISQADFDDALREQQQRMRQ